MCIAATSLDKHAPSSYRPISNLDFISKILERLFLARIQSHITSSPSFNQYQSAYRRHHSTKTSILHTLDNILHSPDSGKSTIVISLDLSAAFDTIDHQILLSRLNTSFRISDTTLSWLQSYLTNRTSSVRIGRHCSSSVTCTTGVPQGSVLGPLLFTAYVSPIAGITHLYSIDQQQTPMTPNCLFLYPHPTTCPISITSHAVLTPCIFGSVQMAWP